MAKKKKPPRVIKFRDFQRMCFCNSKDLPRYVNVHGRRMEWVGIGHIDVGPAKPQDPIIEDEPS